MLPRKTTKVLATSNVKSAEISGVVTVGEITAAQLSKKLGRKVEVGEKFDLGTLATTHRNLFVRIWWSLTKRPNKNVKLFSRSA